MRNKLPILLGICLLIVTAITVAQTEEPSQPERAMAEYGVMRLWSDLGSFTLEGEGRVEMTFTGTLLVSNMDGALEVTGDVRKEFDKLGRQVWFGTGRAVIDGSWRKIQWFGRDMQARWHGHGFAYVYGEYDADASDTGRVQVDDLMERPWFTTGMQHWVPAKIDPLYDALKRETEQGGSFVPGAPGAPPEAQPTPLGTPSQHDHDHDHHDHSH